ncbi:CobW family GTP-binding protein [Bacillus norwichensis]|uniref:GTP-binding protein n=1 Tax=Bacillus norwichensis TaxID=2762217 RepID=A0ABR8VPD2_9BACI|nr:GTP-binding protein [Bacillus norwichensis]MBD8006291.1 GTP-binding protein [Bacillus norwichensis]
MHGLASSKIPVTILTGYLGAGKTTLLNRIVTERHQQKMAIIMNEFGEVGIDNQLVVNSEEEMIEMNNGCICCKVRGDLIKILRSLVFSIEQGKVRFDRVLIETTGLADPAPVAQTFFMDRELSEKFEVDSIVTVVDCRHVSRHLDDKDEAQEQIAFADVVVMNKLDLLKRDELLPLEKRVSGINPTAKILYAENCKLDLNEVLGIKSFELNHKLDLHPHLLEEYHHHHHHDDKISSVSFVEERPLDRSKLNRWMSYLIQEKGEDLLRYKGILYVDGVEERVVFQGLHMLFAGKPDRKWREEEVKRSQLVFIGKNLDKKELKRQFRACLA